jgi:Sensory domain in DIguanylate Cyclases and Two-component system
VAAKPQTVKFELKTPLPQVPSSPHFQKNSETRATISERTSIVAQEVPCVKDFSLFKQAVSIAPKPQQDFGTVSSLSRREFDEHDNFLIRAQSPCLEYACLMIENALLMRTNRSGRIYAGFERLSFMQPVVDRYLRIADISEAVYVFGEHDWQPPRHPNIRYITLQPGLDINRESFLIADCSNYHAALVALDEDGIEKANGAHRSFRIFKSSNPAVVNQLAVSLEGMIDWSFSV